MNQKRIIFMSPITSQSESIGLWKKVKMQIEFFESNDYIMNFVDITKKNTLKNKILRRLPFAGFFNWKLESKKIIESDIIYIRYHSSDYQLIKLLSKIRKAKSSIKIIIEIPTFPYDNEVPSNFSNIFLKLKDKINRKKLEKYVDYIITYSKDKKIFNVPTIQLSNVIDFKKIDIKKTNTKSDDEINLIAVATFSLWHGYDRVIQGMNDYYSNKKNTRKVILHLVGEGEPLYKYKSMVKKYKLDDYIIFYGALDGKKLSDVYDICEIGLDSMGRHRSNVFYNSSLKGKEYGAKGLPIISGVETELDNDQTFKYYMRIPSDDSPVDITKVINFYNDVYNNKDKNEVKESIREYNEEKFDSEVVLGKILKKIGI